MRQSGGKTLVTEEPYALIAHVRVCGGAGWVTAGSTRKRHRPPVPAPEEGTREPQSAQERASCARRLTRWCCTSGWSDEIRVGLHTQAGGWLLRARRAMTGQRGVQSPLPPVQTRVVRRVPYSRQDRP